MDYATRDATATQPGDYEARRGTLTFNPGETRKEVVVPVHGDTAVEVDEMFAVDLSNAGNATIAHSQGVAKILNDDIPETRPFIGLQRTVAVTRGNGLRVGLRCTGAAEGRCRGTVSLLLLDERAARAAGHLAGRRSFSIAAARTSRVTVRLSRRARRLLARRGRLRVAVRVSARDASGRRATLARTVTVRQPRARGGSAG